ncbi:MAG TPA: hypothetical protein VFV78_12960 [Vicinamibacterales bacterium]|nr:hypothetical protein [Vicinamibacterales bacterium]
MNRTIGWASLAVGIATGLIMGLWSFDGPVHVPAWLGEYGDTSRRLARLGHIAFIGLGLINILLSHELPKSALSDRARQIASRHMNFGNIVLPIALFAAAAWRPAKYVMAVPATAVFVALCLAAWGARSGAATEANKHDH